MECLEQQIDVNKQKILLSVLFQGIFNLFQIGTRFKCKAAINKVEKTFLNHENQRIKEKINK